MADTTNLEKFLTDVADSIRGKTNKTTPIAAESFDEEIDGILTAPVAEKIVAEANQILEDSDVVKVVSAPVEEPVLIPEKGIAEVLADKTVLAESIGLTCDKIVQGEVILGIEGTAEGGGGSGSGTEDATATVDDVLYPKTFYADNKKQIGNITTKYQVVVGGMNSEAIEQNRTNWVADVNDEFGIAVVYTYNSSTWYIYEWKDNQLGSQLKSMSTGTYPGGSLIKNVSIAKQLNNQGYLNIWCHGMTSASWSDDMRGYLGVVQYNPKDNTLSSKCTVNTSKPGGYTHDFNEDGNMAICPTNPNKCFVTYHNKDRMYMQLLVYNNVSNTLSRTSHEYVGGYGPCYSCEWNDDGTYVLVSRGSKSHPEQYFIIKINSNNSLTRTYYATNTKPSSIYKHYIILGNKIYDFSSGSLTLMNTWSYFTNYTQGGGITWTYKDYLFTSDYGKAKVYCFRIQDDLTLVPLFVRDASTYVGSSYAQYMGTLLMPMSNSFLYFSPTLTLTYRFSEKNTTNKISSAVIQGETFGNTSIVTATKDNVLLGKTFLDKDGENTGTMANNGYLSFIPSTSEQSIPKGYTSGGYIAPINAAVDNNIIPENIRDGVTILGVEGTFEGNTGGDATSDGVLQSKFLLEGHSAVVDGKLIEGTMPNHASVWMPRTDEEQEIPTGYYDILYVPRVDASTLEGYTECSDALDVVLNGDKTAYTEINYVQTTGNEYINASFTPTSNTKVEMDITILHNSAYTDSWIPIFGSRGSSSSTDKFILWIAGTDTTSTNPKPSYKHLGQMHGSLPAELTPIETIDFRNTRHTIVKDKNNVYVDGELVNTVTQATFSNSNNMLLFTQNTGGTADTRKLVARLYSCKIYDNDVLVRDFIPVRRDWDNTICLYDKVSNQFFLNKGTGKFISGGVKI